MTKPIRFSHTMLLGVVTILALGLHSEVFCQSTIRSAANLKIVHAGTLFTGPQQPVLRQQTILIRGKLIEAIRSGYLNPSDLHEPSAEVIDLQDSFVMPGLIDTHVHLTTSNLPSFLTQPVTDSAKPQSTNIEKVAMCP